MISLREHIFYDLSLILGSELVVLDWLDPLYIQFNIQEYTVSMPCYLFIYFFKKKKSLLWVRDFGIEEHTYCHGSICVDLQSFACV